MTQPKKQAGDKARGVPESKGQRGGGTSAGRGPAVLERPRNGVTRKGTVSFHRSARTNRTTSLGADNTDLEH